VRVYRRGDECFVDRKRYLWVITPLYAFLPALSVALFAWTGRELALGLTLVVFYAIAPVVDWILGEDRTNPPESVVPDLEADRYYRVLTYATVPLHFVSLVAGAWAVSRPGLSSAGSAAITVSAGLIGGLGIVTGHELGHKQTALERWLAKAVLSIPGYGHFTAEHNRGHHLAVSTPEDSASARMGESIYRFAPRETLGGLRRGWHAETQRLQRRGHARLSWRNEILQSWSLTALVQGGLVAALGATVIPFLIAHNAIAWWQLTTANYIEHYGLLRARNSAGRYESCKPWHSWNSNHVLGNLMLFQLERHSDHHAHPTRRYQSLRHFDELPTLPMSYGGMYMIALIPRLWFRMMDPRLLALEHVHGDLDRVNVDPARRARILVRHGGSGEPRAARA
jgi:alkane 1-monooxygenase